MFYDFVNLDINFLVIINWLEIGGMICDKCFNMFCICMIIGILIFNINRNKVRLLYLFFLYRKYMVYFLFFGVINL